MKTLITLAAISLVLTGCAMQIPSTDYTSFTDSTYSSRALDYPIKVFRTSIPERKYEELGVAIVDGGGFGIIAVTIGNSYENAIARLKAEARLKGGDAVIDIRESTLGDSSFVTLTGSIVRWM